MNVKELKSYSDFHVLTKIAQTDLGRNLQIDSFRGLFSFTVKL